MQETGGREGERGEPLWFQSSCVGSEDLSFRSGPGWTHRVHTGVHVCVEGFSGRAVVPRIMIGTQLRVKTQLAPTSCKTTSK